MLWIFCVDQCTENPQWITVACIWRRKNCLIEETTQKKFGIEIDLQCRLLNPQHIHVVNFYCRFYLLQCRGSLPQICSKVRMQILLLDLWQNCSLWKPQLFAKSIACSAIFIDMTESITDSDVKPNSVLEINNH